MRETDPHDELEKLLMRLMPVALSDSAQAEIETQIDELAGTDHVVRHDFSRWAKWLGGIAAALAVGIYAIPSGTREAMPLVGSTSGVEMVVLTELDRMESIRDEGLFVDPAGSAVRKMSVRVIGESRIRDEETGIEVTLTEPREEMYLMPISTF
jgi:hypothetical protein